MKVRTLSGGSVPKKETNIISPLSPEEEEIYTENIIDLYKNPHNKRKIDHATYTLSEHNPLCGDEITLFLLTDGDSIVDASFQGSGCAISQSSASLLTDALGTMALPQAQKLTPNDVLALLGIPLSPSRVRCGLLPFKALQKVFNHHETRT